MAANLFSKALKSLRAERGITQTELAERMFVTRSTINRWENGSRLPDNMMIAKLSEALDVDINVLLNATVDNSEVPNVILVDDNEIILKGGLPILEEALPNAMVFGFTRPSEAVECARVHRVAMAFLDIEMGKTSGLSLCRELLEINPRTNVVYLTAYVGYAFDAWGTGACGFMRKPLTVEGVNEIKKAPRSGKPFRFGRAAREGKGRRHGPLGGTATNGSPCRSRCAWPRCP